MFKATEGVTALTQKFRIDGLSGLDFGLGIWQGVGGRGWNIVLFCGVLVVFAIWDPDLGDVGVSHIDALLHLVVFLKTHTNNLLVVLCCPCIPIRANTL